MTKCSVTQTAALVRLRSMMQRGVPLEAILAEAVREGIDTTLILKDDDLPENNHDKDNEQQQQQDEQDDDDEEEYTIAPSTNLFRTIITDKGERQVEFLADLCYNKDQRSTHIAALTRRLVQSVQKRGLNPTTGSLLTVSIHDLYNALGLFRGVQLARHEYNSTISTCNSYSSPALIRSKRKPWLEQIRMIGMPAPSNHEEMVNIDGLDTLVQVIQVENRDKLRQVQEQLQVGVVSFDCFAELYKPGTHVLAKNAFGRGVDTCCLVSWCRFEQGKTLFGTTRIFKLCLEFVVSVGKHFTTTEFVEQMDDIEGRRQHVSTLAFIPLDLMEDYARQEIELKFKSRGELYSKCAVRANFLGYSQGSFYAKNLKNALRTSGRVMVDTSGAYDAGYSVNVGYDPMVLSIKYKYKEYMLQMRQREQKQPKNNTHDDASAGDSAHDNMILFDSVPEEYLHMTWPAVVGFSFTSKAWGDVLVDGLYPIAFQEKSFEQLVLPPSRKRMIKALVRHSSDSFNDIISGKGEGSVFLLYGPPGVGKTLTAEAISEMLQRPLYSVSLGQLGTTPAELETKLGEILELCGKWDALILLDEADIFLEKRTTNGSLERNAMVSVMLRLVEYFKGVLFLTSNRVDSLDPAFKTRITLALRYDQLDKEGRNKVWLNLLDASGQGDAVDNGMIDTWELADKQLNGREIKNAIRLAMALAKEDDKPLTQEVILETVNILLDFNEKMDSYDKY